MSIICQKREFASRRTQALSGSWWVVGEVWMWDGLLSGGSAGPAENHKKGENTWNETRVASDVGEPRFEMGVRNGEREVRSQV